MTASKGWYSIRQVAEMTGISTQLIRKWEERYGIIQPHRQENGYRVYSEQDVMVLKKMQALIGEGYSVKNAILTLKAEEQQVKSLDLAGLVDRDDLDDASQESQEAHYVQQLLMAGEACDESRLTYLLQHAYHGFSLSPFLDRVVSPFLREVGHLWEEGAWSEFQEHIASQVVRDYLIQLRRNLKENKDGPLLLGTCLPHEWHEIPIHILLLHAAQRGWRTVFLHAAPAEGAIEKAVDRLQPNRVILSAITMDPFAKEPNALDKLDAFAGKHPNIKFFAGGPGIREQLGEKRLQFITVTESVKEVLG
ncbi:MAG: MerR family transcriptional regulator [Clostridia bacterium]